MGPAPLFATKFLVFVAAFAAFLALESFFVIRWWRSFLKNTGARFQLSLLELFVVPLALAYPIYFFTSVFLDPAADAEGPVDIKGLILLAVLMAWCQLLGAAFFLLRARSKFGSDPFASARGLFLGAMLGILQFVPFIVIAGRVVH